MHTPPGHLVYPFGQFQHDYYSQGCKLREEDYSVHHCSPCLQCLKDSPPSLWHGATTVGPTQAGLLYYVTKAFNQKHPDEERMPYDGVPGFPWSVEHR